MMLVLIADVMLDLSRVRRADGKGAVTALPMELGERRILRFDPRRRGLFDFFQQFGQRNGARKVTQDVDMVLGRADSDGRAVEVLQGANEITVHRLAKFMTLQPWHAILGAEDNVNQNPS